jgi:hypothetical protein
VQGLSAEVRRLLELVLPESLIGSASLFAVSVQHAPCPAGGEVIGGESVLPEAASCKGGSPFVEVDEERRRQRLLQ